MTFVIKIRVFVRGKFLEEKQQGGGIPWHFYYINDFLILLLEGT